MSQDKSNHEGHEGHEGRFRMRLASPLSPEAETAMWQVIGSAIEVHRALGPGYLESIYKRAMCIALAKAGMSYECEKAVEVMYEGVAIPGQRVDLIRRESDCRRTQGGQEIRRNSRGAGGVVLEDHRSARWTADQLSCSGAVSRNQANRSLNPSCASCPSWFFM